MGYLLANKKDSLLKAITEVVGNERTIVALCHALYTEYGMFDPKVFYLGTTFDKNNHSFFLENSGDTYLVTIGIKDSVLLVQNLYGGIDSYDYHIEYKENIIKVVHNKLGYSEVISIKKKLLEPPEVVWTIKNKNTYDK